MSTSKAPLKGRGGPGRGQGRKGLSGKVGEPAKPVSIKMTEEQHAKYLRLGGAPWVRAKIDRAREPEAKESDHTE